MQERRTVTIDVEDLRTVLRQAVYEGCKDFAKDVEVQERVGESLYQALVKHGLKDTKIWVGGKVIAALGLMLVSLGITLYISSGGGK